MNIREFYDPESLRQEIKAPFKLGGRIIACNGCAFISAPATGGENYEEFSNSLTEKITEYLAEVEKADLFPMPKVTMPDMGECETCNGTGKATRDTCEECDGDGEVDAETDYNTYFGLECKSCDGHGFKLYRGGDNDCHDCHGTGKVYHDTFPIAVDGINVNAKLLKKIINEPGLMVKASDNMLLFKAGDYSGVLMAMKV